MLVGPASVQLLVGTGLGDPVLGRVPAASDQFIKHQAYRANAGKKSHYGRASEHDQLRDEESGENDETSDHEEDDSDRDTDTALAASVRWHGA